MSKFIDLTGIKFNHLTVVKRGEDLIKKNGKHEVRWLCECDCGNPDYVLVLAYNLKNSNTQSCGCEHLKNAKEQGKNNLLKQGKLNKKYNRYDLSGEYGIGYTLKDEEFYFDIDDYDKIKDYCWYKNDDGYIVNKSGTDAILMHRLIMGLCSADNVTVDHIYHKTYDNRKSQLRIATHSQNNMNKKMMSNNTSGTTGIWFDVRTKKWAADIGINHETIHLGQFNDINDAISARKSAEEKYFGEFSYKRSDDSYDKC